MTVYISGKISALDPQLAINDFSIIAENLRDKGYEVTIVYQSEKDHQDSVKQLENKIFLVTGYLLADYSVKSRKKELFYARLIYTCHAKECGLGNAEIGISLNRSYAAIRHCLRKYPSERKYNREFRELAEKVECLMKQVY